MSSHRITFAFAVALLGGGCAQNAFLELQILLPPNPPGERWFAQVQARDERTPGFEREWSEAESLPSTPLGSVAAWNCISVQSLREGSLRLRVRFCRTEDCTGPEDASPPERLYDVERPFYIGARTSLRVTIPRVPVCAAADEACTEAPGVCLDGRCACHDAADCPAGLECVADVGCVEQIDRCSVEGCTDDDGATTFCTESGRHFCEQQPHVVRDIDRACDCETVEVCGNGVDDDCDGLVDNGRPETCDGADDDCDGSVDEGLDLDEDGYSWCPTAPGPEDCDDADPDARPDLGEDPCDGVDNDCDPGTIDGADCTASEVCSPPEGCVEITCATRPELCGPGQFCDESSEPPSCAPMDMTCLNPAFRCAEGMVCNPATADCVSPMPDGSSCDFDAECASEQCISTRALRLSPMHTMAADGLCGRTCCGDDDCLAGEACWVSGSGVGACVAQSVLEMGALGPPVSPACVRDADCAAGETCSIARDDAYEIENRTHLACTAPLAAPACDTIECLFSGGECIDDVCRRQACSGADDCWTGICVGGNCTNACGSTADCRVGACVYGRAMIDGRFDVVRLCSQSTAGAGTAGEPCDTDDACRDGACLDARGAAPSGSGECADACCSDRQCAESQQCRVAFRDGQFETRCLPRPRFGRTP